jgi:hypothetical protein
MNTHLFPPTRKLPRTDLLFFTLQTYAKEPLLQRFFKILSTNMDANKKVHFASTVEGWWCQNAIWKIENNKLMLVMSARRRLVVPECYMENRK